MNEPALAPRGREYLQILMNRWIVIVCATALAAAGGWLAWETGGRVYVSQSKVLVATPGGATTQDAFFGSFNGKASASTFLALAKSEQVTSRTITQLGLDETSEDLAEDIEVGATDTAVLTVTVTSEDPDRIVDIANAVTANMITLSREMLAVNTGGVELVLVDGAGPPMRTGSLKRHLIWSTSLGLALSVVLVLTVGLMQGRLLGRGQVAHVVTTATKERRS